MLKQYQLQTSNFLTQVLKQFERLTKQTQHRCLFTYLTTALGLFHERDIYHVCVNCKQWDITAFAL